MKNLLVIATTLVFTALDATSNAASRDVNVHRVAPSTDARIVLVEPGALPSSDHPEGTVFASVLGGSDTHLALADGLTGTEIARSNLACDALGRGGARYFATCGRQLVTFDLSLREERRVQLNACKRNASEHVMRMFFDGARRIVLTSECDSRLFLRVIDTQAHRSIGQTSTNVEVTSQFPDLAHVWFHGESIVASVASRMPDQPETILTLTNDAAHVAHSITFERGESFEDDGAHFIVWQTQETADRLKQFQSRGRSHAWLNVDRDYTLSESLTPIASKPHVDRPIDHGFSAHGLGGNYVKKDFDLGSAHYWLTGTCCGGNPDAGLFAGRVSP